MTNFVVLDKEQFESYLPRGYKEVEAPGCKERVYEGSTDSINVGIRIYSSVDIRTDKTRDIGSDAIRIVFWDTLNDRPLGKGRRINRVEGKTTIGDRIKHRIDSFMLNAYNQTVIDFDYVKAVLNSNAVSWNNFAVNLLESLEKFGSLTEKQLAYVLGKTNPRGKNTFEATVKMKDPDFVENYLNSLEENEDENYEIENFKRITESDDTEETEDVDPVEESISETTSEQPIQPEQKLVPTNEYKPYQYPFEYFNPIQSEVLPHIKEDKNMIISSATSSGKTIMAEVIMDYVMEYGT